MLRIVALSKLREAWISVLSVLYRYFTSNNKIEILEFFMLQNFLNQFDILMVPLEPLVRCVPSVYFFIQKRG